MRPRDLDALATTPFDLLVIGGGIHGLATAYEGASRGLRTALVEAGDFGSAATFNHQRTVHGGLRALQYGRLRYARHSILERRALARMAPWFLRPLPFIVGTYRSVTRGRLALRAAFRLDEFLGRDRNRDVEPELHLPAPRLISLAATQRFFPGIRSERLTGGAQWYDYQMVQSDRLTFAFAAAADRAGATLANYVEALTPLRAGTRVAGMRVRDVETGREIEVKAAAVVNAAGAHAGTFIAAFGGKQEYLLLKAMSILTARPAHDIALAAPASHGRMLTAVPWRGYALVGTSQSQTFAQPGDTGASAAEVATLIADANSAFPALKLTADDIRLVHRGLVPAVKGKNGIPDLRMIPEIFDHARDGSPGAFTIASAKYSSARGVAERAIGQVARQIGKRVALSRTATTVLPGAGIADHEALAIERCRALDYELPIATIRHLTQRYAERTPELIAIMHAEPALRQPLDATEPTFGAEVAYVIRYEMARTLPDVVLRRTTFGATGRPADTAMEGAARIAAAELGWDEARTAQEIAALQNFYRIG